MELPSISTEPQTAQSANAPPMSSATASSRRPTEPYRDRVKQARADASRGAGWEDLMVAHHIGAELARQMVGLGASRSQVFIASK